MDGAEENLAKPVLVLVRKNVMVPLALPASRSKTILGGCVPKKKTKVARPRRNRVPAKQTSSFCPDDARRVAPERGKNIPNPLEETHENSNCKFVDPCIPSDDENKRGISSLSLPVAEAEREIPSSGCATNPSNSARPSEVEPDAESASEKARREKSNWLLFRRDVASRESSATEIRCCSSSNVNGKFSYTPENQPDGGGGCRIKYSWEDLENWVPPSEKRKITESDEKTEEPARQERERLDCGIKYSWQIIGKTVQTSRTLMEYLRREDELSRRAAATNYPCTVKYSWQIIGTGTQVSFRETGKHPARTETNYWDGKMLEASERSTHRRTMGVESFGKSKISYNETTQTTADKVLQTDTSDCRIKYSWQNLTKAYLKNTKYP